MAAINPPHDGLEARDLLIRGLELIYVRDEPEAGAACIRLAAEYGLARAQGELGTCYDYGRGVPEDETQAMHWYRMAAEQGDAEAMYDLAELYRDGAPPGPTQPNAPLAATRRGERPCVRHVLARQLLHGRRGRDLRLHVGRGTRH